MSDLLHQWVNQHRWHRNFNDAIAELMLTPQERYAYQHHLHNLTLGGVPHDDGSLSSFLNMTVNLDGREYIIPKVWDNQILDDRVAIQMAVQDGLHKWPSYDTPEQAEQRYAQMHGYMERDTQGRLNGGPNRQPALLRKPNAGPMEGPQPAGPAR